MKKLALMLFWALVAIIVAYSIGSHVAAAKLEPEIHIIEREVLVPVGATVSYVYRPEPPKLEPEHFLRFTQIVAGEAGCEPDEGIAAVAQCLWLTMQEEDASVFEVQREYQYAGFSDEVPLRVTAICREVIEYDLRVIDEAARFFYSPAWMPEGYSAWHEAQQLVAEVGAHRFFRLADGR